MDVLKEPTKEPFWYQANINNEKWWSYFMKKNQDYPSKATESTKKSNFVASQGVLGEHLIFARFLYEVNGPTVVKTDGVLFSRRS